MKAIYAVHIVAGILVVFAGYLALFVRKGGRVHRRAGDVFVGAMLTTATFGIAIAIARNVAPVINVPAAAVTAYLVVTALTTVRPRSEAARRLDVGALLVAIAIAAGTFLIASAALLNRGAGTSMAVFPFVMFGVPALLGSIGDIRVIRFGPPTGRQRLARHLWRMCFALFIAAISFFVGQARVLPEAFRPFRALPVLVVLFAMIYWMVRVRRQSSRRLP